MPLNKDVLTKGLQKFMDADFTGFTGFPETKLKAAEDLADAVYNYSLLIFPASATAANAKDAMMSILGITEELIDLSKDNIEKGLGEFVKILSGGMVGYSVVSPSTATLFLSSVSEIGLIPPDEKEGSSSEDCVTLFGSIVDTWFRTGTASNSAGTILWN
jgi:hypothetical protein